MKIQKRSKNVDEGEGYFTLFPLSHIHAHRHTHTHIYIHVIVVLIYMQLFWEINLQHALDLFQYATKKICKIINNLDITNTGHIDVEKVLILLNF